MTVRVIFNTKDTEDTKGKPLDPIHCVHCDEEHMRGEHH
jgi:hypothetical protein